MKFANGMSNGCQDQVSLCKQTNRTSLVDHAICSEATNMCRDNVEGLYYEYSGRGPYDIRSPASVSLHTFTTKLSNTILMMVNDRNPPPQATSTNTSNKTTS